MNPAFNHRLQVPGGSIQVERLVLLELRRQRGENALPFHVHIQYVSFVQRDPFIISYLDMGQHSTIPLKAPLNQPASSQKQLGLLDATMIIMGSMIWSGIFLAPALIAGIAVESHLAAGSFDLDWVVGGLLQPCA